MQRTQTKTYTSAESPLYQKQKEKNPSLRVLSLLETGFCIYLLILLAAEENTQLHIAVDGTIPDKTRKGEPELVIWDQLPPMSLLSELVVGHTSDDVEHDQRHQDDTKYPTAADRRSTSAVTTSAIMAVTLYGAGVPALPL